MQIKNANFFLKNLNKRKTAKLYRDHVHAGEEGYQDPEAVLWHKCTLLTLVTLGTSKEDSLTYQRSDVN